MAKKISTKTNTQGELNVQVINILGKSIGKILLPKEIFGVKINLKLIAQAIRVFHTNQRLGTRKAKTRSEVSFTTKKMYRQKGTGRARHGSKRAPIFIGGGVAHGPKTYDYKLTLSKKMKKLAFFSALTDKLKQEELKIVTGLDKIELKTKHTIKFLTSLGLTTKSKQLKNKTLLVVAKNDSKLNLITRNIKNLFVVPVQILNTYQILTSKTVLFSKDAITVLEQIYSKKNKNSDNHKNQIKPVVKTNRKNLKSK
jgi:large subunit ribosomal protein L4